MPTVANADVALVNTSAPDVPAIQTSLREPVSGAEPVSSASGRQPPSAVSGREVSH